MKMLQRMSFDPDDDQLREWSSRTGGFQLVSQTEDKDFGMMIS